MRIAFLADPASPNGWYRGIGPMIALARRGHDVRQVIKLGGGFHADLVDGCDLLHIHRQHDERTVKLFKHAKQHGIAVVWDDDDDLTAVPKNNAAHRTYGGVRGERSAAAIRRIVGAAELVTTPSRHLAEIFTGYGASRTEVIENYVRDECLETRVPAGGNIVTIGWLAGKEHHLDLEQLPIRVAFERLLDHHRDVQVVSIGVGLGLRDLRYRHVPRVRFDELDGEIAQLDVGIAPIADTPLNRARSNIKLKEYAVMGVPWLASPRGAYVGMGERQGGRLVTDDRWFEELDALVSRERDRRKLGKKALKWGRDQTVSANVVQWERLLQEAVAAVKG